MQLDIESIRTFLAVLDHGGMTRAAEHLDMSQSAVSWKIKRLEAKVGKPLLVREGHAIRPSFDGRNLMEDARMMVELHDRAVSRLQSADLTGVVRIGSNEGLDPSQMASVLGRFQRDHPRSTIEFIIDRTGELMRSVDEGAIDIALIQVDPSSRRPDDISLGDEGLVWASGRTTTFDEGVVPLVTFGENCFYRPLSEPRLTEASIDYTVAISVQSSLGVRAAVEAGLGVGVLGRRYVHGDVIEWPRSATLPELPAVEQVARLAPGPCSPTINALLETIIEEVSTDTLVS